MVRTVVLYLGVPRFEYQYGNNYLDEAFSSVAYPGILFRGGIQQIQLRTEDIENGDLGAVAP